MKRTAPAVASRQSKRARSTIKTSYVEPDSDGEMGDPNPPLSEEEVAVQSNYEDGDSGTSPSDSDLDAGSEEDGVSAKASRGRSTKRTSLPLHRQKDSSEDLWKSGAKLELGTQVIIKKPKAREAGDTPYTDDTIHPNTMLFLKDLAVHNDRQWLKGASAATSHSLWFFAEFKTLI